jgi:iron complex outermembrane receptor protein
MGLIIQFLLILSLSSWAFAQQPHTLEKIVVTPAGSFQTISLSTIKEENLNSLADLLDYASGLDLRYRLGFGIQGDLSLRGSTYEQVAVLIDGVRINDPQTGHHNLDIPLTLFDVERVELRKQGASSLYGSGALAGSVNIITKKPLKRSFNLDTLFGEHALFGQAFSMSLPQNNLSSRFSFDHKIAKAARPNTDFQDSSLSLYLNREFAEFNSDILCGYQKKDFGASSFYSNLFPEEEEHTETLFLKTGLDSQRACGFNKANLYMRRHRDKFILIRNNPALANYHTTYIYGLNSLFILPLSWADFSFGMDMARDQINSTNLGKHSNSHQAASFGFNPQLIDKLTADFLLRADYYRRWNELLSYNCNLGYNIISEKLSLRSSAGRSFRTPSFTELYYSDAANKGDPGLNPEKADNFSLGLQSAFKPASLSLDGFYRRGLSLIDFTRASSADRWQARNLGRTDFYGIEFYSELKLIPGPEELSLKKIIFSYNYTRARKKASGFLSKYALDILKNQFILTIKAGVLGLGLDWQFCYNERYYGEKYFIGNVYLSKKIKRQNFSLEPFIKVDNFSDTEYREIAGVLEPGRWIKAGLKFQW